MILPTKYENLKENSLIIGAQIIAILKSDDQSILQIHEILSRKNKIELNLIQLIDTLTFLFLAGIVEIKNNTLRLTDDSKKNLHLP